VSAARIVVIGVLSGFASSISLRCSSATTCKLLGISVGSRAQFADMLAYMEKWQLKPVIDRTFAFEEVPDALRTMESGRFFGKLCVRFDA